LKTNSPAGEIKAEQEQKIPKSDSPWSSLLKSVEEFLPKKLPEEQLEHEKAN